MYCIVSCSAVHTAVPPLCHPRSSLSNPTYGFTSIENAAALSSSTSASTSVFSEASWKILWLCIKNPTYTSWWIKSKCSALAMWVCAMHPLTKMDVFIGSHLRPLLRSSFDDDADDDFNIKVSLETAVRGVLLEFLGWLHVTGHWLSISVNEPDYKPMMDFINSQKSTKTSQSTPSSSTTIRYSISPFHFQMQQHLLALTSVT